MNLGGSNQGAAAADDMPYCDPRPNSKRGRVRIALMRLVEEHRDDGALPTSVQFLFYELVSRRVISKSGKRPDQIVSGALTDLREDGHVHWEDIVDETREVSDYSGSATVAADLLLYLNAASVDPWGGHVPFIICESRSLAGVLRDLVIRYRCRIASTNGQTGGFLHTDVIPKISEGDRVGYLGDLDLAGGHIEDNTRRVLESNVGELDWKRLALTEQQVEEHNLPRITKTDKRHKDGGGVHEAVETEALSQTLIVQIVRDWLEDSIPESIEDIHVSERDQRERLRRNFTAHRALTLTIRSEKTEGYPSSIESIYRKRAGAIPIALPVIAMHNHAQWKSEDLLSDSISQGNKHLNDGT